MVDDYLALTRAAGLALCARAELLAADQRKAMRTGDARAVAERRQALVDDVRALADDRLAFITRQLAAGVRL